MKKKIFAIALLFGLIGSQSLVEAAGYYQAVRKCQGEWTAYNCIKNIPPLIVLDIIVRVVDLKMTEKVN